jgi:hypothetical protein
MGKELGIMKSGTHIGFVAGTGSLVFMDFVAYLIRKNLGILSKEEDEMINGKEFKFILFVAFASRNDSLGLGLMEGL